MALVLVVLAALALPGAACADEQPAILKAYDLDWIERVRDDAWPQPKSQRPVICLLDTGVDITPDTPADHPDGPIVARLALDGGTGLAQGTSWEHQHGTQMASIIAAPRNGYGTVGVFPQARIVSIRVTDRRQDEVYITPDLVSRGGRRCAQWAEENRTRLGAVVVAESNYSQRQIDTGYWDDAANRIRGIGGVMVAAVGNDVTATTVPPISSPSVIPVIAGDALGSLCPFSPRPVASASFIASGCEAFPWPDGSSQATAVAGALITAFVTRNPLASTTEALAALTDGTTRRFLGTSWRASMAAYTSDVLASGPRDTVPTPASVVPEEPPSETVQLWRPRVAARYTRGHVRLTRLDRSGGDLHVSVGTKEWVFRRSRLMKLRLSKRPRYVLVWATARAGGWRSLTRREPVM